MFQLLKSLPKACFHFIVGLGNPSAEQWIATWDPTDTDCSVGSASHLGGTVVISQIAQYTE